MGNSGFNPYKWSYNPPIPYTNVLVGAHLVGDGECSTQQKRQQKYYKKQSQKRLGYMATLRSPAKS